MKRIAIALLLSLFMLPLVGQAHTTISSSTPAEGDVVNEPLEQVKLAFGTVIEDGSTMTLESEEASYEFEAITVSEGVMAGTLQEELPNGAYKIRWSIIGADGHPIEGEVPFELNVEAKKVEEPAIEQAPQEEAAIAAEAPNISRAAEEPAAAEESVWGTALIAAVLLVAVFGAYKLWKKK